MSGKGAITSCKRNHRSPIVALINMQEQHIIIYYSKVVVASERVEDPTSGMIFE